MHGMKSNNYFKVWACDFERIPTDALINWGEEGDKVCCVLITELRQYFWEGGFIKYIFFVDELTVSLTMSFLSVEGCRFKHKQRNGLHATHC